MQWILQRYEDTEAMAAALDRLGLPYSFHKVVPFIGELDPAPQIQEPSQVLLFGSYSLWRYAEKHELRPGVFRIRPFLREDPWRPHMLNAGARTLLLRDIPANLPADERPHFFRPVSDNKEVAGRVHSGAEIVEIAQKVVALPPEDIPNGSLRPDSEMMLAAPTRIQKEWRIWVVQDRIITASLYKEGARVTYRAELDDDAGTFAETLIAANPAYAAAYVMDICRTATGLHLLETNCINAAGFYAADLTKLAAALDALTLD